MQERVLFLISDGTGISVETLSHCIITQFDSVTFDIVTLRYINTKEKAHKTVVTINEKAKHTKLKPLIFCTFANKELNEIISKANAFFLDFMQNILAPVENELNLKAKYSTGLSHSVCHIEKYDTRIEAIHYSLQNDDGISTDNYDSADLILVGVSRTGKTPTSLYLAVRYSLKTANFPITPEDLVYHKTPGVLKRYKNKIFGLTASYEKLHSMREERLPNSKYASLKQCKFEVEEVEHLFEEEKIQYLDTTNLSMEEAATKILHKMKL